MTARVPATLLVAFLLSGSAAIIYQLIWQRVLSGVYGTNVEAVTTVVAAFMMGLGTGSLIGGWLGDHSGLRPRVLFVVIELAIGLFGWLSVPLFREVGMRTVEAGPLQVWLVVGALLLVPTILMGATLPVLATAGGDTTPIGEAVGRLYAANTLGAALGCVLLVLVVAGTLGQRGATECAALLNVTAALLAWISR
jgi:predicted membrane-bound spermidine synthase